MTSEPTAAGRQPDPGQAATGAVPGLTPPPVRDFRGVFVTDVLMELGFADERAVREASETARVSAKTPERCLVEKGVIDEGQLALAVAARNGLDHADLDRFPVDPDAPGLIDRMTADRYTAIPLGFAEDGALFVAFEEPYGMVGIDDIEVMTHSQVRPVVAAASQIRSLIDRLPGGEDDSPPEPPPLYVPPDESSQPPPPPAPAPPATPPEEELKPEPAPPPAAEPEPEPPAVAAEPEPPAVAAEPEPSSTPRLSSALLSMQDGIRDAIAAAEATDRRIEELERERRGSADRERQLERELEEARRKLAPLERGLTEVAKALEAAGLATAPSERAD